MPRPALTGIHHVTAICGDPQRNLEFYEELLGLRLVKQTVNFDAPTTWGSASRTRATDAGPCTRSAAGVRAGSSSSSTLPAHRPTYFREPGGDLYEIATDGPGFAVDESVPFPRPHRTRVV